MGSPRVWSLLCSYLIAVLWETTQGVTVEAPSIHPWLRDSVTVRCVGSTVDMTQMNLYKDDRMVTEDHSHQITRTHTTVELNINSVSDTDQGSYTCVKNDKTKYGQIPLRVIRRFRDIPLKASSRTVPVQGSVTLECSVQGFTNSQWLRRSSFNAPDFEILNVHTSIIHVTRGGVYSCRGEDKLIITKESNAVDIWETVTREESVPVLAVMRLVAGMIVLLILLLIVWHYCTTFGRSQETKWTSAEDQATSAPHDPSTHSHELQVIYMRNREQEDVCVFSEVLTHSAAEGH
ncbi:uncharacterized protein LOC129409221 isoform X2 [Boleophthalmus pectinirostris]|uniref:uncharacterized protein LOC129409221 isoform X2 n=1 Tax=Boleophthalmus pectinirostris TaxID=150288 RepID=UPI00242C4A25|nr:uncharacterized protein LOC129409221 isoform X2 [Boleophthalmus pectinirostris]